MTTDVASALLSKADQLNAADLIGGPIIIEITKVTNLGKGKEQPLIIGYKGDEGKPWKPCKSMGRVMAKAWGEPEKPLTDGNKWIGRYVRLYCAENVRNPDGKIGCGIRITHTNSLSHISQPMDISIPVSRGKYADYHVEPLIISQPKQADNPDDLKRAGKIEAGKGMDALKAWWKGIGGVNQNALGAAFLDELKAIANKPKTEEPPENDYPDMPVDE